MNKKLQKKWLFALTFIGLLSVNVNAQSWDFKDAATGTDVWSTAANMTLTTQKSNSVVYTTTGIGAYAFLKTTTAGVTAGAVEDVNSAKARRLMAVTLRVGSGGPTALRIGHPQNTAGDWLMPVVQITAGDSNFKTYVLDLATWSAPKEEWTGVKNTFELQFKTWNGDNAGADFSTPGITIEIDRIEFINNSWDSGASPANLNSGNNGNWFFSKPAEDGTEDILFPTDVIGLPNINVNLNVKSISFGAGTKVGNNTTRTITVVDKMYFGVGASFVPLFNSTLVIGGSVQKIEVKDNNWHLLSSPVNDEQYNDAWVTANGIASGTGSNRGISTYDNGVPDGSTGHWRYFQSGGAAATFADGVGYSVKSTSTSGDIYEFTGTFQEGTISPAITQSNTNYNLLGNPYNANIDIAAFITENTAKLTGPAQAIYVWNGSSYTGLTTGNIQPGQGFFVDSNIASGTVDFTLAMQTNTTGTFYKSLDSAIELKVSEGESSKITTINYIDGKTQGLDPRFDIGLFTGVSSDLRLYTQLLENNEGVAFERQALPNADLETMVVPVGVKAAVGKEITFTAEALNLEDGLKVILEDRQLGVFTQLDVENAAYKVVLTEALNGVGRFYIHTTAKSALSTDDVALQGVSIYKANNTTLKIAGLQQGKASVSLFNIQGKQILTAAFEVNGVKEIALPKLATGVYLVQLTTGAGKLNKKIILE